MKQILQSSLFLRVAFLSMFSCAFIGLQSQDVYFSDDFDDEDISDWSSIDADGDGIPWLPGTIGIDGSGSMISYSWNPGTGAPLTPNNYITSSEIDLSDATGKITLAWKAYAPDQDWALEHYKVVLSSAAASQAEIDAGEIVFEETLKANGVDVWTENAIDVSAYAGKKVFLTFVHYDVTDQFVMSIDDVAILSLKQKDAGMKSVAVEKYHEIGGTTVVSGRLQNVGEDEINSIELGYTVNGGDMVTQEFTGLSITSLSNFDYTFDEIVTLDEEIEYDVVVTILSVNGESDLDDANNLGEAAMAVLSFKPDRKTVIEEATGTWCGFCPRGAVMLDRITERYEDLIGIAVHNGDPMTIGAYDDEFSQLVGGYPSMLANRLPENVMPGNIANFSDLEQAYFNSLRRLTPATLEMEVGYTGLTADIVEMTVEMTTQFAAGLDGDYRFSIVLTEDGVTGTGDGTNDNFSDFDQVNYYGVPANGLGVMAGWELLGDPVPATDMVYDHVAIELVGGFFGDESSKLTSVDRMGTYTHTEKILLSAAKIPNLNVVGMLLDNETGEILNAEQVKSIVSNIDELYTEENNVTVYPNPFSGETTISMNLNEANDVQVSVIDNLGRVVSSQNYGTRNGSINLTYDASEVTPGLYIMHVKVGNSLTSRKVTIN